MRVLNLLFLVGILLGLVSGPGTLNAQDLGALTSSCISRMPTALNPLCHSAIFAARSVRSIMSVADGMGSETAGSSSIIGRRKVGALGSRNYSASLSSGMVWSHLPSLNTTNVDQGLPNGFNVYNVKATFTAGLFEGLTISPGWGGILGLDLVGSGSLQVLTWDSELQARTARIGSYGVRLGLLRESFSTPGITLSVVRQYETAQELEAKQPEYTDLFIKSKATRLRAVVGKELGDFGVLAGVGWNRNFGLLQGTIPGMLLRIAHSFSSETVKESQTLYFSGVSYTNMVFQISLELGLAEGLNDSSLRYVKYEPVAYIPFSRIAFRARF